MGQPITNARQIAAKLRELVDQFVNVENVAYEQSESRLQISVNGKLHSYEDSKGAEMFSVHCGKFEGEDSIVAFPVASVLEIDYRTSGRVLITLR